MEDFKKKNGADTSDKDIVYSQSVKAGKRIYYLDVKKNRKDEMFLAITESKKIVTGEGDSQQVNFEKHKIFLYQEDFDKFLNSLNESIRFIRQTQENDSSTPNDKQDTPENEPKQKEEGTPLLDQTINIDIDF
ncbi:DUF3276 family protein [Bacteroidales bacterium SW292]|jgi:hypothetical protein|nr:DUF3276 family protein [Bacteroidales bacterium SW292]